MENSEIENLVKKLDINNYFEIWKLLQPFGKAVMPYLIKYYQESGRFQSRLAYVFFAIKMGRENDQAFQLGIMALNDRATLVRYRACGLLAYSLRKEALPLLKKLLNHEDRKTVEDAKAAINAIKKQNSNLFIDRRGTGRIQWE